MKIQNTGVFILVVMLLGCTPPQTKTYTEHVIPNDTSEMSFALKTMHFAGVSGFSDSVRPESDTSDPSVLGTAATISYLTSGSSPHFGDRLGLSQSSIGLGFILESLRNEKTKSEQYDRMLLAFIPKDLAPTKEDAVKMFNASILDAVKEIDRAVTDEISQEIVDFVYDFAPTVPQQQVLIKTSKPLFYDGNEGVLQGSGKYGRAVRLFYPRPAVKPMSQSPLGDENVWRVGAMIYLTLYEEPQSKQGYALEYIRFVEQLPERFLMFKLVDRVPTVLQSDKMHLFVKPD